MRKSQNILSALWLLFLVGLPRGLAAPGLGDGTLPFSGSAILSGGESAELLLKESGEESGATQACAQPLALKGRLVLDGISYPVASACLSDELAVTLELGQGDEALQLSGQFSGGAFHAILRGRGHVNVPLRFFLTP